MTTGPPRVPEGPDPGDEERAEALRILGRRAAIWSVPILGLGILITLLGIPFWISLIVMVVAMLILIFELDI